MGNMKSKPSQKKQAAPTKKAVVLPPANTSVVIRRLI
jgi:hypothetical protein